MTASATDPELRELVRELLDEHAVPCRECGEPATREVQGRIVSARAEQSATIWLCDTCPPPRNSVFARYRWFPPYDLPHGPTLRRILEILDAGPAAR